MADKGRCRGLVVRNTAADLPGPGEGMEWLVWCPRCVTRAQYAAQRDGELWRGVGESYAADKRTAWELARGHESGDVRL